MISPTVGRKVWYWPSGHDLLGAGAMIRGNMQPIDATVVAVWGPRMVNVVLFDANGNKFVRSSVTLLQDDDPPPMNGPLNMVGERTPGGYVEWMPYQLGQAKAALNS